MTWLTISSEYVPAVSRGVDRSGSMRGEKESGLWTERRGVVLLIGSVSW